MRRIAMFVLLAALAVVWITLVEPSSPTGTSDRGAPTATADVDTAGGAEASLPDQARETIAAIDAGGPFPYDRDGAVFENRERLLPRHPRGYWREYTVRTPGSDDRGARRLVEGRGGELYYTDDHYDSFRLVRSGS